MISHSCAASAGKIAFLLAFCVSAQVFAGSFTSWFSVRFPAHPWYIGAYGGYTHNTLYMGGAENARLYKSYSPGSGWTAGIFGRYQLFNWLGFQAGASWITKAYSWERTGAYANFPDCNAFTNSFVDFPLLINLSVRVPNTGSDDDGLRAFINGGGWLGVWVLSIEKGKISNRSNYQSYLTHPEVIRETLVDSFNGRRSFDTQRDNRFDGGLIIGAGLQYDIKYVSIFAEWRYEYSLTDMAKNYEKEAYVPNMNDTWTLRAGILIHIFRKKMTGGTK
jgi:hypothetical protein